MSFDPTTAKPDTEFDPSTAKIAEGRKLPGILNYSPVAGVVEGALSLGSGAAAGTAAGFAGLAQGATNALGLTDTPAGDRVRQVSEALTYAPRTKAGQVVTGAVAYPFEKLAEGADRAGGAVTDATGSPVAGTAVNTAIQALPLLIGRGAKALPKETQAAIDARARQQSLNATKDARIAEAREAGLSLTPSEAGAGPVARTAEGLSGEPKLAKLASKKSAGSINEMIRRDIGLPDDVPGSRAAHAAIRAEEGAKYEAVKNTGRFDTDARYQADLHAITKGYDTAAKDFAHRTKNPVKETIDGLNVKNMDAASAVEEVKNLRTDADKAYRAGDKQLGAAYKEAAQALDNMLDRHLKSLNDPALADAVAQYQAARVRIAKTYLADKAVNDATGNYNAAVYGKALKDGKKLDGDARKVGEFSQQFPRSTQRVEGIGSTSGTIFDLLLGGGAGVMGMLLGGVPGAAGLAMAGARPAARSLLLSDPAQAVMTRPPSYGKPAARRLQDLLSEHGTAAGVAGTAAGQR